MPSADADRERFALYGTTKHDAHIAHLEALRERVRRDPAYARQLLIDAGIISPDGGLAAPYRQD